jgi:ABC-type phosphate transport system substrate-binding protein
MFCTALLLLTSALAGDPVVLVVHADNPSAELTAKQARNLLLRRTTSWSGGERVRPVFYATTGPAQSAVYDEVLGLDETDLERMWIEARYAKGLNPPPKVADAAQVLQFVTTFPGALGFVAKADLPDDAGVKVVYTLGD